MAFFASAWAATAPRASSAARSIAVVQRLGRDHLVGEPDPQRLDRVDLPAGEDDVLRA